MNKKLATLATSIIISGLLVGCSSSALQSIQDAISGDSTNVTVGGTVPLKNKDGKGNGLAAVPSADKADAVAIINEVSTKGRGAKTGYARDKFGSAWTDDVTVLWGGNGCDTRNDILKRDLTEVKFRDGKKACVVSTGSLEDPYTGKTIAFKRGGSTSSAVQIDHVIPLSLAWQMGAAQWDTDKRRNFANDPLNLIAVDGPANGSKSDSSPASWLPPNKNVRCSYAVRVAQVAVKYSLPVTQADKDIMLKQCK